MIDLEALLKVCGAVVIASISVGMAFLAVRQLARAESKRRSRIEKRITTMIDYSDFSEKQKYWLINSAAAKMIAYQAVGHASSIRFYTLNEISIVILGLNIAIPASVAAFWPDRAMQALAATAVSSAFGVVLTAWDKLEQNSSRWQDYHEIAALIEDALDELLTDTPEIPLDKQFNQFVVEYREINKLERELQRKRVNKAQEAASEQSEAIKSGIKESREKYRSEYEHDNSDRGVSLSSGFGDLAPVGIAQPLDNVGRSGSPAQRGNATLNAETLDRIATSSDAWDSNSDRPVPSGISPEVIGEPTRIDIRGQALAATEKLRSERNGDTTGGGGGLWTQPGGDLASNQSIEEIPIEGAGAITPSAFVEFSIGGGDDDGTVSIKQAGH
jgi:hypothetical protein